jgi:tyrosine-protein phosphatase SIW14
VRSLKSKFVPRALATSLVFSSLLVSAAAAPPAGSIASKVTIGNFGQVSSTYYRGEQPEGRDYTDLAAAGIKAVVDLQADGPQDEKQFVEAAGMTYLQIPMTTRVAPTAQQLASFLKFVNDPANQPVYVHCAGGRHRTGVMTAVYRMTNDGWTSEQAFKEMKQYKFGADFLHPEFKKFVYGYHAPAAPAGLAAQIELAAATAN